MQDSTPYWIGTGIFAIIGCVLVYFYQRTKGLLDEIWAVDTYESKELARMCSGGFEATVEVQGEISCDEPLTSLAAEVPCCWYNTKVEREFRKTETHTDSDGHSHTDTHYEWETEMDVSDAAVFNVTDKTGVTRVYPAGAEIDAQTIFNEVVYSYLPWFEGVSASDTGKYRITERVYHPYGYTFVLGRAKEATGGVLITKPDEGYAESKAKYFIISRKSEQELTQAKQKAQTAYFWLVIASFVLAAAIGLMGAGIISVR